MVWLKMTGMQFGPLVGIKVLADTEQSGMES